MGKPQPQDLAAICVRRTRVWATCIAQTKDCNRDIIVLVASASSLALERRSVWAKWPNGSKWRQHVFVSKNLVAWNRIVRTQYTQCMRINILPPLPVQIRFMWTHPPLQANNNDMVVVLQVTMEVRAGWMQVEWAASSYSSRVWRWGGACSKGVATCCTGILGTYKCCLIQWHCSRWKSATSCFTSLHASNFFLQLQDGRDVREASRYVQCRHLRGSSAVWAPLHQERPWPGAAGRSC